MAGVAEDIVERAQEVTHQLREVTSPIAQHLCVRASYSYDVVSSLLIRFVLSDLATRVESLGSETI
jgi:hypothetical protein